MNDEIREILDYFQKDVDKYEESKRYLMKKYGYDEETIDNISQHERHINIKKLLDYITNLQKKVRVNNDLIPHFKNRVKELKKEITNLQKENDDLQNRLENAVADCNLRLQENERLNKEVAKLHIIQEEYGSHIENTHIIDDYQKTYFMTNKWLIELKDGRFVDINVLNSYYEDYKSRCENAYEELTYMSSSDYVEDYDIKQNCWIKLSNILQNGSENNEQNK